MNEKLRNVLLNFSTEIHKLESQDVKLPPWLERFWLRITIELEKDTL